LFLCNDRFLFSPEGKRCEVACSRQGVTGSWVQFIYITLPSLMLLNWNTSLVLSTPKTRACYNLLKFLLTELRSRRTNSSYRR
jgi:hypothetical protein